MSTNPKNAPPALDQDTINFIANFSEELRKASEKRFYEGIHRFEDREAMLEHLNKIHNGSETLYVSPEDQNLAREAEKELMGEDEGS
jgi:hypothetical protein